jgi:hypothetical protein
MKVEIENYRGWGISFDTEKETFLAISSDFDTQNEKKSFAAVKKSIDDYIKENTEFKPFKVKQALGSSWGKKGIITVIGIRKDKRFVAQDEDGDKFQISDFDEKYYVLYDEANEHFYEKKRSLEEEYRNLSDIESKLINEFKSKTTPLQSIKKKY